MFDAINDDDDDNEFLFRVIRSHDSAEEENYEEMEYT